jgi:phosphopantothenoylcysteine decarboxylase/phosphopantothenate--cysteine ligase
MNIMLGISGGIAAYKACDIISGFKYLGWDVKVVMTKNAKEIITPTTLASLSGHPVLCDMWEDAVGGSIDHIKAVQGWANIFLVAPATANVIGKFANGIADDYLSTIYMAADCPKAVAPAMNSFMYKSPAVQRNIAQLKEDGVHIIDPVIGMLACGYEGPGKLPKPRTIVTDVIAWWEDLHG